MRTLSTALAVLVLIAMAPAQQPNSAAGSMVINGIGAAPAPGPFFLNVLGGSTATVTMSGPATTPFAVVNANPALGGITAAGILGTPYGAVDIGPPSFPPLEIIVNGFTATGVAAWIFQTGTSGSSTYPITLPAGGCPVDFANLQSIFPHPVLTYVLTAAHKLSYTTPGPDPGPVAVPAGDDTTHWYPFASCNSFTFYGTTHASLYITSNGNLTFGGGDATYTETQAAFDSGLPRICHLWDDLNPGVGGSVTKFDDGATFTATWSAVPEYSLGGSNTVSVTLAYGGGDISITWGGCSLIDCIVGITRGGGLASPVTVFAPGSAIGRISDRITGGALGSYTGGAMESLNEVFVSGATAFNLAGATANFSPANPAKTAYTLY